MSEPDRPPAPDRDGPFIYPDIENRSWRERDGFKGFFTGRQSLALSFWGLGVALSFLIVGISYFVAEIGRGRQFSIVALIGVCVLVISRMIAWFAIFKCRLNTTSELWTALALICTLSDMVYGVIKWPVVIGFMIATQVSP